MKLANTLFMAFLLCLHAHANDGAFRVEGNQLIPMYETDISVKKEILSIHRINATQAQIEVYYEFYNPKESKTLEIGFEAYSPSGDANKTPDHGQHPYIRGFTVTMNEQPVPYKVSIVHDSLYYKNGQYKSITTAAAEKSLLQADEADFFYVYHFRSVFKQGLNIIRHVYTVDLSSSVFEEYSLDYVLTAAKRWANRQIDDFTLQIDMGEFQTLCIQNSFFKNASEWTTDSTVKTLQLRAAKKKGETDTAEFFIRKGMIVFAKKDFKPRGELHLQSFNNYYYRMSRGNNDDDKTLENFDCKRDGLPFPIEQQSEILPPLDDVSKKMMHNLPFARRGYIFKSPELATYFGKQPWYLPNPAYAPAAGELTQAEQEWLLKTK